MGKISAIIFDLGAVVLNLDPEKTTMALQKLAGQPVPPTIYDKGTLATIFDPFEVGAISPQQFRARLRQLLATDAPDPVLDQAWNAMLLDLPIERLDLIVRLRQRVPTYLLSNTNAIHQQAFEMHIVQTCGMNRYTAAFEAIFYSHLIQARKPDPESFAAPIGASGRPVHEILFIDDNLANIEGAQRVGLKTHHLVPPATITNLPWDEWVPVL